MKYLFFIFTIFCSTNVFAIVSNDIINGCNTSVLYIKNNSTEMVAIFEPNEYTCQTGYFLPANIPGCRPCPQGFTCNGGTFTFNENISQGILGHPTITQNAQNICSKNALPKDQNNHVVLTAQFEPNTVTLNFDDDIGNTTTTTCTYDGLINLPETPVRPGYNFNGWKLKTTNE